MKGSKEMPTFYGSFAPQEEARYKQREQEKPSKVSRRRRDRRVDSESDEEIRPTQDSRKNYNRKKKEKQRDMYMKGALGQHSAEKRYSSRDGDILALEKYGQHRPSASNKRRHRRKGIEMAIPEDEQIDKFYESRPNSWEQSRSPDSFDIHGARDLQRVRRKARKVRVSILNRAEQLIIERKRHEMGSSTDDDEPSHAHQVVLNERKIMLKRPFTYVAKERVTSPSDDEFVKVKTTVSPLPDIQQEYEISPLQNNPRYYSPTKVQVANQDSDQSG